MKKFIICLSAVIMALSGFSVFADSDFTPYNSYIYNAKGDTVAVPNAYLSERVIYGGMLNTEEFYAPEDMFVANGLIFIADTGNSRIVVLNRDLTLNRIITGLKRDGEEVGLYMPKGLFASEDGQKLYICDSGLNQIIVCGLDGNILLTVLKPTSPEFDQTLNFEPEKITVDKSGNMYVLCNNVYQGAVVFTPKGEFDGYFGSTTIQSTLTILTQKAFKQFMTKAQKAKLSKYVPAEFENLTIRDDFIYTVAYETNNGSIDTSTAIRKLNPGGVNIAKNKTPFGDLDTYYDKKLGMVYSKFCDTYVDDDGYIYALDSTYGKIFIYDDQFNLLFVFGGAGEQKGLFQYPAAIDSCNGKLLVLDRGKNSITVFTPTGFFASVKSANTLFNEGLYEKALEPWNKVLTECNNYTVAYTGIGRALFNNGDYKSAMTYFKKANDADGYSDAYKYYRLNLIMRNFTAGALLLILFLFLLFLYQKLFAKKAKAAVSKVFHKLPERYLIRLKTPFTCMRHPFEGFYDMREQNHASYPISLCILAVWVAVSLVGEQFTGFIFNTSGGEVHVNMILLRTVLIYLLWVVASIGLRTFLAGRERLRDICAATSYMLLPLILAELFALIASQLLIKEEGIFITLIMAVGYLWSALLLIAGTKEINEYEFGKTVGAISLTLLGTVLIVFLFILFYSSLQQVVTLLLTVVGELKYRFL